MYRVADIKPFWWAQPFWWALDLHVPQLTCDSCARDLEGYTLATWTQIMINRAQVFKGGGSMMQLHCPEGVQIRVDSCRPWKRDVRLRSTAIDSSNTSPTLDRSNTTNMSTSALCSLSDFLEHEYDYIVVGGGTAGLCIAARLTENPDVKVGVVEAGKDLTLDPQVYTPSLYPTLIGREKYDWCFETIPQEIANGKKYSMPRGKLLGGSSAINYLVRISCELDRPMLVSMLISR